MLQDYAGIYTDPTAELFASRLERHQSEQTNWVIALKCVQWFLGFAGFSWLQLQLGLQAISFTRQAGRCFPQVHGAWCITRYLKNVNNQVTTQGEKKKQTKSGKLCDKWLNLNVAIYRHNMLLTSPFCYSKPWHLKDAILQGIQVREAAAIVLHGFETWLMIAKKGKSKNMQKKQSKM